MAVAKPLQKSMLDIAADLDAERNDPYHRLRLIKWWDQERLRAARVMVAGAGALGNEIVKNLALLGVGHILICDFDTVEPSNLSRSVLFRRGDEGQRKAEVAARRAMELNPDVCAAWFHGDITADLGRGVVRRMDVVIGGLDNRAARLALSDACWSLGVPYIDGGTHTFEGQVRVFQPPQGPCYACTLSEESWKGINERIRCNLLLGMSDEQATGKVATTPIASSIIAALEVQEAVELLHGMPAPVGQTFVYNGYTHEIYVTTQEARNNDYHQHDSQETHIKVVEVGLTNRDSALAFLTTVRKQLGDNAVLNLANNLVGNMTCRECQTQDFALRPLNKMTTAELACPTCGDEREMELLYKIEGHEKWLDRPMVDLGISPLAILFANDGDRWGYFELSGDAPSGGFWERGSRVV